MAEKRKIEWQAPGPGIPSMVKNHYMNPVIFLIQLMPSNTFVKFTENNYGQIFLCKQIRVGESRARREHLRKLAGNLREKRGEGGRS